MRQVKQSTQRIVMVFMADESDHVSGLAGLTLTITASKDGAAFASISPTVTDRGSGWYAITLTTSHTGTLGDLALHVTGTGADPADVLLQVVADLPGIAQTGDAYARLGAAGAGLTALGDARIANLDAAVTTRAATGEAAAALAAYGGPTKAELDAGLAAVATATDMTTALASLATLLSRLSAANAQAIADWIDGGRLDLLLDAAASRPNGEVTVNVVASAGLVNQAAVAFKVGDRRPALEGLLKHADGTAVNLAGATVKFLMRPRHGTTPKVDAAATVIDAAAGQVRYEWAAADLDTVGHFEGEWEVDFGSSVKQTFPGAGFIQIAVGAGVA